jgi:hypothetical protein
MMMSPELTMAFTSCETRARNFKPEVVEVDEDLPPQEIKIKASRTQAAKTRTLFFKQATPKVMIRKDLDAKLRIITERFGRTGTPRHPGFNDALLRMQNPQSSCILDARWRQISSRGSVSLLFYAMERWAPCFMRAVFSSTARTTN